MSRARLPPCWPRPRIYDGRVPVTGEYEPSPHKWVRDQVERYEATDGREANTLAGTRRAVVIFTTRGRKSGNVHTTVVNLFTYEGSRYLLAPRGHTQWVRNLRAVGEGELRLGRRSERFTPVEIADADKTPLIRLYLRKWAWETGAFFDGLKADSPQADIEAAAPGFPVFRIVAVR